MASGLPLRVATFEVDITPPLGSPLCGGWIKPLEVVDDPLLAKGVVLEDGERRFVLCALDWCEVRNSAHDQLRQALAAGAGTQADQVAVQCLHQHNAPIVDVDAQALIDAQPNPLPICDAAHFKQVLEKLTVAAREAAGRLTPFDRVATGEAKVEQVAATRRVKAADGKILVRYSSCQDPELRAMPEGVIDPLLKTISFLAGEKPLVRLHYYATHPQSYYGDGRGTSDFPGIARQNIERETGVFQIYFTGCAGDVTAGKYNDGSHQARGELIARMAQGMRESIAASHAELAELIGWQVVRLPLPPREDAGFTEADAKRNLESSSVPPQPRLNAAITLAYRQRAQRPIEIPMLSLGKIRIVHLPGEPFIDYQLTAQRLAPGCFVAVAGYADGGPGYVCSAASYSEGGYEPTASLVGPRTEMALKGTLAELLAEE
jgi:hypothetical protein